MLLQSSVSSWLEIITAHWKNGAKSLLCGFVQCWFKAQLKFKHQRNQRISCSTSKCLVFQDETNLVPWRKHAKQHRYDICLENWCIHPDYLRIAKDLVWISSPSVASNDLCPICMVLSSRLQKHVWTCSRAQRSRDVVWFSGPAESPRISSGWSLKRRTG